MTVSSDANASVALLRFKILSLPYLVKVSELPSFADMVKCRHKAPYCRKIKQYGAFLLLICY